MDELRDRITEAIYGSRGYTEPLQEAAEQDVTVWHREAQAVIDALGLQHVEGTDGEWRYVTAWQNTSRPF